MMNHMQKLLPVLFVTVGMAMAADKSAEAVKTAEKAWATATAADDEATLRQVLSDDLTYTHSTGETDTKQVFMANLKSGVRKYHKVNHESMSVRVYGNTAVLMATAQIETSQKGGTPAPAHLRFLHVWLLKEGRWQLVAHQSLRLPN
jgi:ketosteroid isomerase-like protein